MHEIQLGAPLPTAREDIQVVLEGAARVCLHLPSNSRYKQEASQGEKGKSQIIYEEKHQLKHVII